MVWIFIVAVVIVALFLMRQSGRRLNEKLGLDPDSYTSSKGWEAIKRLKEAEKAEREDVKKWAEAGKVFGDEKLGKAMGETFNEMCGECPECGGLVWNESKNCGHCGKSLHSDES